MTGVELLAAASAVGSGAGAAGTGAALGAGAAGAAGAGAAAAGTGAAIGAAGAGTAAAGMTAAEAASLGLLPEVAAGAGEAGLLAGGEQAAMLAAQNVGLEGGAAATNAGLSGQQASMLAAQNEGLLGATEATNAAADPALTQGMQQPWYQQAQGWMSEKPLGQGTPSRGTMMKQGMNMAQPQQQQSAPMARQPGGQYQPVAQSNPYVNGTQTPEQFLAMADFLKRRY